ncbi:uncharacterized protein BDW70DRAFT_139521 [Aspergillus foveolatus]|uniref:uncharacterized protein n=1 Tax=Aspergillus foveolatus TaxID=210207 RepID=UPI003CCD1913
MAICKLSLRCQPRNVLFWNEGHAPITVKITITHQPKDFPPATDHGVAPREQASWYRKPGKAMFLSFRCRPRAGRQRQITN